MATVAMTRDNFNSINANTGMVYHETVVVASPGSSDIFTMPPERIYAIAADISGSGSIQFSNDSISTLQTGTPTFTAWDGVSAINPGVTGFKVVSVSGSVTAKIAVKTSNT